jgi:hypothetical protein
MHLYLKTHARAIEELSAQIHDFNTSQSGAKSSSQTRAIAQRFQTINGEPWWW